MKQELGVVFLLATVGGVVWWLGSNSRAKMFNPISDTENVENIKAGNIVPDLQTSNTPDQGGDWSAVPNYLKQNYPTWEDAIHVVPSMVVWSLPDVYGPQQIPPNL